MGSRCHTLPCLKHGNGDTLMPLADCQSNGDLFFFWVRDQSIKNEGSGRHPLLLCFYLPL